MNKALKALFLRDIKTLSLDPMSLFIALIPVVIGGVIRLLTLLLFPWLERRFQVDASPWVPLVIMLILPMPAMMAGWCAGFLALDEKDQELTAVLSAVPVNPLAALSVRLGWSTLLSMVTGVLMLLAARPSALALPGVWAILACGTLTTPPIALLLMKLGRNKVQGLTLAKGLSLIVAAPLTYIMLKGFWRYTGGIIPLFWNGIAWLELVQKGGPATGTAAAIPLYLLAGLILNGLLTALLVKSWNKLKPKGTF
jgi:fluoroquinolone transport system permease protein